MDHNSAKTLIEDTFNFPFDEGQFRYFVINLLNNVDEGKAVKFRGYIKNAFKSHVKSYQRLGTYIDPEGEKVDVLVVELRNEWALERSRTMLRNFTADYLKTRDEKDAALVAYYTTNPEDWRFSFIRMEYKLEETDSGKLKVKEDVTPAKRYSFLVGKNEPNHTAQAQLVGILENDQKNPTLNDIETAFSVDAVTKQFYKDYRSQFEKLWNELNDIIDKDPKIAEEFETKSIDTANFAKKLMGQIVFLYFLQKKGWLGVGKDENGNFKEWGKGPKNFLHRLFGKEFTDYSNFFNDVLEPLFYEALATERPSDIYSQFNCKIPFLNGGLFEPLNDYNWEETDIRIDNDLIGEVLKTYDQYNFTVREDEPLEKEVAVDPEMLGKVFENLLPENLRKGKGAYYTPRTIVHYMCQESLINYLNSVSQASLLENRQKQDAYDTMYFDYESLIDQRKRNLPHWEQDGVTYFVNFRLWDSIPKEVAENIRNEREEWKRNNKIDNEEDLQQLNIEKRKEYYRLFSKQIDDLLDNGYGSCILKNPDISIIVEEALEHFHGERYFLDHWVVMPNHVHILVKPLDNWSLEKITHSWKSYTANEINKALERDGQLWMHESFDHIVRSPEQLQRLRKYITENPKNLPKSQYRIKSNPTFLVDKVIHNQDDCDTIPKKDIETLIREGDIILELETAIEQGTKSYKSVLMDSIKENAQVLDDALANIKVCDPAIGSGAFPVGMLNEIVKARNVLTIYLNMESINRVDGAPTWSEQSKKERTIYNLKRHCIQNSLYGVDIDPGAIEIAKLRLWLSLVVDEDDYTTIQALPNLDYKIMQGNSLIEEFHGISLDIEKKDEQEDLFAGGSTLDTLIETLHKKQADFFNAEHPREKTKKRQDVETSIYNIFHHELEKKKTISPQEAKEIESDLREMTHGNKTRSFFPWKLYFADVFREKGGFDVVIANPPYGVKFTKSEKRLFNEIFKHQNYQLDSYLLFFEKVFSILIKDGTITFIIPNTWLTNLRFTKIRKFVVNNSRVLTISHYKPKIFEATVDTEVVILSKSTPIDHIAHIRIYETPDFFVENNIHQAKWQLLDGETINIFLTGHEEKIFHKIRTSAILLSTVCKVIVGLTPYRKGMGKPEQTKEMIRKKIYDSTYKYDGSYRPLLRGRDIYSFINKWDNRRWIKYGDNLAEPRYSANFDADEKIVMRQTGDSIIATIDTDQFVCLKNMHVIHVVDETYHINFILGLLNSNLMTFYFQCLNPEKGEALAEVKKENVEKLVVKEISYEKQKPFINLVDQILTIKRVNPATDTSKLEDKIDQMVYGLYGLTEEEKEIVEKSVK